MLEHGTYEVDRLSVWYAGSILYALSLMKQSVAYCYL